MFRGFRENTRRSYLFIHIFGLRIRFNPTHVSSPMLSFNGLVMFTNKGSIACKYFKKGNVGSGIVENF